jgi:sugar phosphate isomerase/epimerase
MFAKTFQGGDTMRLGGAVFNYGTPEEWVRRHKEQGFTAAYFPLGHDAPRELILEYKEAAEENGIVIAEVGAWSNPMSRDKETRKKAFAYCVAQLELAEITGALCCVNIAGSYGPKWDGPHSGHYTRAAFDEIVNTTQAIIDAVNPKNTVYSLEPMPFMLPDTPESYLELIAAIGRGAFAPHLDVCNMINSPRLAADTAGFINRCFDLLGPQIISCHAKDIALSDKLTVHLDEVPIGQGCLCYRTLTGRIRALPGDVPLMIEHLDTQEEYEAAAGYIRGFL